jgi:hypothetical protein
MVYDVLENILILIYQHAREVKCQNTNFLKTNGRLF